MLPDELNRRLIAQPFEPFRVRLDDGQSFDIYRQEAMWVGPSITVIAVFGPNRLLERYVTASLCHVATVEALPALPSPPPHAN
jgi:hypothetical protein